MTRVAVHAYADLRRYLGDRPAVDLEVEPGQTIADVLARLGIPAERTRIIFVNSRAAGLSQALQGGERVDLFSAIGGG